MQRRRPTDRQRNTETGHPRPRGPAVGLDHGARHPVGDRDPVTTRRVPAPAPALVTKTGRGKAAKVAVDLPVRRANQIIIKVQF